MQMSAEHSMLNEELGRVKSNRAAGATVTDDLKSDGGVCERPVKRAKRTLSCKTFSTTPLMAKLLAVLTESDDLKHLCEA